MRRKIAYKCHYTATATRQRGTKRTILATYLPVAHGDDRLPFGCRRRPLGCRSHLPGPSAFLSGFRGAQHDGTFLAFAERAATEGPGLQPLAVGCDVCNSVLMGPGTFKAGAVVRSTTAPTYLNSGGRSPHGFIVPCRFFPDIQVVSAHLLL